MRVLPSGSTALLVELANLDEVQGLYAALCEEQPSGVLELVPAARTVLLVVDTARTTLAAVEKSVRAMPLRAGDRSSGELVELPVEYDGADLDEVAGQLGCDSAEVVRRHTQDEWTVAFCGFAPGFGYLTSASRQWHVARRASPRTKVPAGSVALAAEFSAVYPSASPGGWQLIGRTGVQVFDLHRDPPALLPPGTRVRFVAAG